MPKSTPTSTAHCMVWDARLAHVNATNLITQLIIILIKSISICTARIFAYMRYERLLLLLLLSSNVPMFTIQCDPNHIESVMCDNTNVDDAKTEWFGLSVILSAQPMARLMWNIHYYSVSIQANYWLSYIVWSLPLIRTYALFAVIDFFLQFSKHLFWHTNTHTQPPSRSFTHLLPLLSLLPLPLS